MRSTTLATAEDELTILDARTGATVGSLPVARSADVAGALAPVRVVDSFEQGLSLAAAGRYELAATVLTGSIAHAQQAVAALPVGSVKVNEVFGGAPGGSAQPRGESGHGFGYGPELLDEFTRVKVVHVAAPPATGSPGRAPAPGVTPAEEAEP
jgi:betaine-aldehyde dehydrogenase